MQQTQLLAAAETVAHAAVCAVELTSCTILKNRQDACSTRKFTLCGTGILPVHKKLIENGATSQLNRSRG
ncbi:hypothetical protein [Microcoleus sp. OTE_8_concoct_300]|uniref:hypothetical protein n=1 Tax=Microcoleus sp. OTE_8_concoct_300 TaxID=2964710 RepID=UPI00403F62DB